MSVQSQIDRLNAIKQRIRTNLVAQGITVPADTMLEQMAEQILSVAGEDGATGSRGFSVLRITTAPSSYTTATGGFTPAYRVALSTVKSQSKAAEVLVGDTVIYSYYTYPVGYVDSSYVYLGARVSIRGTAGAAGTTPVKGTDYWTPADQETIIQDVIAALGTPVFGRVDADNNIILSGDLADGTYILKYENADGTFTDIDELIIGGEPVVYYGVVFGQPARDDANGSLVYFNDMYAADGSTNYKMLYQTTGEVPLYKDKTLTTVTPYYPIKVPAGKTKMTITLPNLAADRKVLMAAWSVAFDGTKYTRKSNSGWQTEGVYQYTFTDSPAYVIPFFRNNSYGSLLNYDLTNPVVTWE